MVTKSRVEYFPAFYTSAPVVYRIKIINRGKSFKLKFLHGINCYHTKTGRTVYQKCYCGKNFSLTILMRR
jgi:hypothetical protein